MYTKVNPFIQGFEAIKGFFDPSSLYNLRKQSSGSKILYSIIYSIFLALMICIIGIIQINTDEEFKQTLEELPNFSYANGSFYFEEPIALPSQDSYLVIDTNLEAWDVDILKQQAYGMTTTGYKTFQDAIDNTTITEVLLLSRTNIVSYKKYSGEFTDMTLYDFFNVFGVKTFSKDIIIDGYQSFVTKAGLILALFIAPYQLCRLFFVTILLTLIGLIINAACGSKEIYPTVYWISFYIQSILMVIKAIGTSVFDLRGFLMTCVCLVLYIIIMIRTLKCGDVTSRPTYLYNTNDDLDFYMQQTYTVPEPTKPITEEPPVPTSYNFEPQNTISDDSTTTTPSPTGLSLKTDE